MAVRIVGNVAGVATGPALAPFTQITIQPNMAAPNSPIQLITANAAIIAALQALLGLNTNIYIAVTQAEITAIEAAVVATSIDVGD